MTKKLIENTLGLALKMAERVTLYLLSSSLNVIGVEYSNNNNIVVETDFSYSMAKSLSEFTFILVKSLLFE